MLVTDILMDELLPVLGERRRMAQRAVDNLKAQLYEAMLSEKIIGAQEASDKAEALIEQARRIENLKRAVQAAQTELEDLSGKGD